RSPSSGPYIAQALTGFAALAGILVDSKPQHQSQHPPKRSQHSQLHYFHNRCNRHISSNHSSRYVANVLWCADRICQYGWKFAGYAIPITVGLLTNGGQTLAQWRKMFLITAAVGAGSSVLFLGYWIDRHTALRPGLVRKTST
ncbi:hypothetical protein CEXT_473751, partial [Caerostris extrusa]